MLLTPEIKQQIINHSQYILEAEVCGLICENGEVYPCANLALNQREAFEISTDYFDEINKQSKVVAIYHTHWQDSQPAILSPMDVANSKALKLPYILYHTGFGKWDYYDPNHIYPYPLISNPYSPQELDYYLGWRFEYNRSDCYTLFRSYYKGMLGIELPDFPRGDIEETTSPDWDMFTENFEKAGFCKLEDHEFLLQPNDVILMNIVGDRTHHAAILIDPSTGKALHNLGEGRLSEIFMYGGYWVDKTRAVIRYVG